MPSYVDVDGLKFVQLDDGSLVPVNVSLSLEGGTLVKLPPSQISQLQTVTLPANYPLPSSQVADLKAVSVSNFPASFGVSNFPTSYTVANIPATFPLPTGQESILSGLRDRVLDFTRGSGALDSNTLRAVLATDQPTLSTELNTATMSPIDTSTSGDQTIITPTATKALRIASIAITAPSLVTVQLRQGTVGQGQTNLSGAMPITDYAADFSRAIALAADRSFVINVSAAINLRGYVTWWEV